MKKITVFLVFFISSQSLAQNLNQNNQPNTTNTKVSGSPIQQGSNVRAVSPQPTIQAGSNVKVVAPIQPANDPKLTPQEKALLEKNIAEQKEFVNAFKNLNPAQQKKFQEINQVFSSKMLEYSKTLNQEIAKISKNQNLMSISTYIFKGKLDVNPARNSTKTQQDFYQKQITEYQKLSPDKKKLIKQEFIKFRKNINALEKKRRQELKILLNKDFNNFKEHETEEEIKIDDKSD